MISFFFFLPPLEDTPSQPQIIMVPVPVPVFVPIPLHLYTQYAPVPFGIPVPVSNHLEIKADNSACFPQLKCYCAVKKLFTCW